MRAAIRAALIVIAALLALVLVAILVVTNTDIGRERVRRIVVSALNKKAHGVARIGKLGGNLLKGVTLTDFTITDSAGNPFLSIAYAGATYDIHTLWSKRIVLTSLVLDRPVVVLNHPPGSAWNYDRIFPSTPKTSTQPGFGSWITANNVRIIDGRVVVRTPWSPSDTLAAAARDSIVHEALSGATRANVVAVPNGYQEIIDLKAIEARLPHIRLADPDTVSKLFDVGSLSMTALPFRPPAAEIRNVRGAFLVTHDSLWFRNVALALPGTRSQVTGTYSVQPGDMRLAVNADTFALGDVRWLDPRLPAAGGGSLALAMMYRKAGPSDYTVRDAHLVIDHGSLAGAIGITMGGPEELRVHDTNLRFAGIDTKLVEQLVPRLTLPKRGTFSGRAALAGTMQDMRVDADVSFAASGGGTSRVVAVGGVGMQRGATRAFRFDSLHVRVAPLHLALVRAVRPKLKLGGTLAGTAMVNGSTRTHLSARVDLVQRDRSAMSHVAAVATYVDSASKGIDADVRFDPIALGTVGSFVPALELHGTAAGRVRVAGAVRAVRLAGEFRLPDGGTLALNGSGDLAAREKRYDVTARLHVFNLRSVTARGPSTSITAVARARGEGLSPKTMRATIAADVSKSAVDSVPFDSLHVRVALANGMASIDSTSLTAPIGKVLVDGTFGVAAGQRGALVYKVEIDSLAGLRRILPKTSGVVPPRPGRIAVALARARADSARLAEKTEVERAATGEPAPKLTVDTARAIAKDSIGGSLYTVGVVRGGMAGFDVRGRLGVHKLVARGSSVRNGRVQYVWLGARTPASTIVAGALLDTVQAAGFALDSLDLRATYRKAGGELQLAVYQDTGISYNAKVDYTLRLHARELHIRDLALRFDTTRWVAAAPSTVMWGTNGIEIDSIDLRDRSGGRIYVNGRLPATGPADVVMQVNGLELANVVGLMQGSLAASGILGLDVRLTGTRASPEVRGAMALSHATFRGAVIPDVRASFAYANELLNGNMELSRGGERAQAMAVMNAAIPINLALSGVQGSRLLDRPMRVDVRADSLALDALPKVTDLVADVHGEVIGALAARGTPQHPSLAGRLAMEFASFRIVPLGVTFGNINGSVRLLGDSIAVDSLVTWSGGGRTAITGDIGIATASRPSFALHVAGRDALVMDNTTGRLRMNADIDIRGPYTGVDVTGRARVLSGAIYLASSGGRHVLALSDTDAAHVVDTSLTTYQKLIPKPSPLVQNLRVNLALAVSRDTWVRNDQANVEIYSTGPLDVEMNRARHALIVRGVINTDQGQYTYLGRQFVLSHGTITFTGEPEINPLLQINATHVVQVAGRGQLNIQILVGGTVRTPTITLQSDAQPPISQSDLISYLAFGQSSSSLMQLGGSSALTGQSTNSGQLAGKAAGLAARQLAAVAVDVAAKQLQSNIARSVGADVFNITPADLPTDFSVTSIETLLAGTQVEAGKYVSRTTFVAVQARPTFVAPGFRIQHRMPKGYSIELSVEPRFLLQQPTLSQTQNLNPTSVLGAFLTRMWRF